MSRPLVASYRLQLTPEFGFDRVVELLGTIARLGVSHLYLSPIAEAVAGSSHGYDVVDHRVVRTEFGGDDGLTGLLDAAAAHGLGVVIDHVPNHVSVAQAELNPHWWAMLRDGPDSDAADWFDVDWDLTGGKVIVPKLGEPLDDLVAAGALAVVSDGASSELHYGPLRFPVAAGTEELPLAELVEQQHYRLAWWRDPERNVRRFFTIDDLVAVRVEDDRVRRIVDTLPQRLCDHPAFDGVRVDHVDGLADPLAYLEALRETIGDRWLLVEKILGPGEELPAEWPVDGTTGYEHITITEHTMLDERTSAPFDALWRTLTAQPDEVGDFEELEDTARREVLDGGLRPDLDRLLRTTASHRETSPVDDRIDDDRLRAAIVETTVTLDRYRTYLPEDEASLDVLRDVVERAGSHDPSLASTIHWFADLVRRSDAVRTRWQQLTGPAMAKGAEDRAFYRHQRLSSLCEVGGRPGIWSSDVAEFHRHQESVQANWPITMLTDTTHDTKRSSGVRARSLAVTTFGDDVIEVGAGWMGENTALVERIRSSDVWLAIQTALTAWPLDTERLHAYLVKSAREADRDTGWFDPDDDYESALYDLAERLVRDMSDGSSSMAELGRRIAPVGAAIGLRLAALQLTCPGVPDLYQGAPAALFSLVDPDNRRPPDWERLADMIEHATPSDVLDAPGDDPDPARVSLTSALLRLRADEADAFGPLAGYRPLPIDGPGSDGVIAFARTDSGGEDRVAVVVLRAALTVEDLDGTTIDLGPTDWYGAFGGPGSTAATGGTPVAEVVGWAGFAVLVRQDAAVRA